jgi:hypothetical protein
MHDSLHITAALYSESSNIGLVGIRPSQYCLIHRWDDLTQQLLCNGRETLESNSLIL